MARFNIFIITIIFGIIACACTKDETPKASVAAIRTSMTDELRRAFLAKSIEDNLTEESRKTLIAATMAEGRGSGFVVSGHEHDGRAMLVTNRHVVETGSPKITFDDGDTLSVSEVLFRDPEYDLAILTFRIAGNAPPGFAIATSYEDSDDVAALGYPYAVSDTKFQTTKGTISDKCFKDSKIPVAKRGACLVKHTAAIDKGSSGGPLLTKTNMVVGVNTLYLEEHNSVYIAVPPEAVSAAIEKAEAILERRTDEAWLRDELRTTCRRFLGELFSSDPNSDFLRTKISDALVAEWGNKIFDSVRRLSNYRTERTVTDAFFNDPLSAYRSAIAAFLGTMIVSHDGIEKETPSCNAINPNDGMEKREKGVRINIRLQDRRVIELTWIFQGNEWLLRDFNMT